MILIRQNISNKVVLTFSFSFSHAYNSFELLLKQNYLLKRKKKEIMKNWKITTNERNEGKIIRHRINFILEFQQRLQIYREIEFSDMKKISSTFRFSLLVSNSQVNTWLDVAIVFRHERIISRFSPAIWRACFWWLTVLTSVTDHKTINKFAFGW